MANDKNYTSYKIASEKTNLVLTILTMGKGTQSGHQIKNSLQVFGLRNRSSNIKPKLKDISCLCEARKKRKCTYFFSDERISIQFIDSVSFTHRTAGRHHYSLHAIILNYFLTKYLNASETHDAHFARKHMLGEMN